MRLCNDINGRNVLLLCPNGKILPGHFAGNLAQDFAESLFKLRQIGPLKDYITEFRRLATRIRDLSPTFRLSCFVGGLREELKHDVKLLRPATVHEAMNFAHEVDAKLQKLRYAHSAEISKSRLPLLPIQNDLVHAKHEIVPRKDMPIKKLTPEEIQYKRQNNLCFYCDEKFVRGHKCARKQILLLDMGYNSSEEEEIVHELQQIEQVAEVNACCITACALYGTPAPIAIKTMKLTTVIKNCPVVVLLDSGSSHNFIDIGMVKKLGWKLDQSHICDVMIVDGGQVQSKGCCAAVPLAIGTYVYTSDMFALPLGGCDIVLGPPQPISCHQMDKLLHSGCYGVILCAVDSENMAKPTDDLSLPQQHELHALLDSFSAVFGTPTTLPPVREHDHRIPLISGCKPPSIRPYVRSYDTERYEAMKAEVDKLQTIGFIREVTYPIWLANSVLVKKSSGAWRMCLDYTNLNKACPKDSFPLPRIDQLVDATAGHELLSFMDAYSGYNQIFMHPADREHTAFITDRGLYCYNVMPFGLKNAGATYQRLVNQIFAELIGTSMEVYVDDMLVKSRTANDHLRNLSLMFGKLKQYNMRLNPSKCAFGVASGKFLGFLISQRGIEANPEKIRALIEMRVPKTKKEVQSLTGRVAALARFISKATDRCTPFFKALKGSKRQINWTSECDRAFDDLKYYMSKAPLLSTLLPGETLVIYLSVSASALSSVLIRQPNGIELPIFYMSHALQDAEQRYPQLEQLAYALVLSYRRLRPYFQAHSINVLTN
ncbi:unnamed protein product, partial [Prunus brigantina]